MGSAKKKSPSYAEYQKALKLVGSLIASPNTPKTHQKLATGLAAMQFDFATPRGRDWLKPATTTAAASASIPTKKAPAKAKAAKAMPAGSGS